MTDPIEPRKTPTSFEPANEEEGDNVAKEFLDFLRYNKKWWLTPIIIVSLLLATAAILSPSPVAPFIYSLF